MRFQPLHIQSAYSRPVNQVPSSEAVAVAHLRVRQFLQTSISCVKPGYVASRSMATTGPVLYSPLRISQSTIVIADRESISPAEFGSMSKRSCSQNRGAVSTELGRGNSVGRNSHCFQSCKNPSGMTHNGVPSRSEVWLRRSWSHMRFKRLCIGRVSGQNERWGLGLPSRPPLASEDRGYSHAI